MTLSQPPSARAPRARWWLLGLALVALVGVPASFALHRPIGPENDVVDPGDDVTLDVVLLDADGTPLYATNESEARRLANETGSPHLLAKYRPAFGNFTIPAGREPVAPGDLTRVFWDELIGRPVGATFTTRVHERPFGSWDESEALPRFVGPFPMAPEGSRSAFDRQFPDAKPGDVVRLTSGVESEATVLEIGDRHVKYRNHLSDGDRVLIYRIGLYATVLVDEATDTFRLRYEAEPGYVFSVRGSCGPPFYDLPSATYRVRAVDEATLWLDANANPFPALVDRDIQAQVTIHSAKPPTILQSIERTLEHH